MQSSWMFKPKYGIDIVSKVVDCFATSYLDWSHNGVDWGFKETNKEGWHCMDVWIDSGNCEYYTETSFTERPVSNLELTESMFVLLVEAGVAFRDPDEEDDSNYYLHDVDITEVLAALCEDGTSVFAPVGAKCYIYPAGDSKRPPRHVDMLDALFTLEAA